MKCSTFRQHSPAPILYRNFIQSSLVRVKSTFVLSCFNNIRIAFSISFIAANLIVKDVVVFLFK